MSIFQIYSGVAGRAERLVEVEHNHLGDAEPGHKIPYRRRCKYTGRFGLVHLRFQTVDHFVNKIVRLDADALPPGHCPSAFLLDLLQTEAQFPCRFPRQDYYLVGKMSRVIGLAPVAQPPERPVHDLLRVALADIDHIYRLVRAAEVGSRFAIRRRRPELRAVFLYTPRLVQEVHTQNAEFPHLVGDVLTSVCNGSI